MKEKLKYFLYTGSALLIVVIVASVFLSRKEVPEKIQYGMSFNTVYAKELGLDTREVFDAIVDELGVRRFRLAAHWNLVEPEDDEYDFDELDYQLKRVEDVGGEVIFGYSHFKPI